MSNTRINLKRYDLEQLFVKNVLQNNIDYINNTNWNNLLKTVILNNYNYSYIFDINWPNSIEYLDFGNKFNSVVALDDDISIKLPNNLKKLVFGKEFNFDIDFINWPESLKEVIFGKYFNQAINNTNWSMSIEYIEFGNKFNQDISKCMWPTSLKSINFGKNFDTNELKNIKWPNSLETFGLYKINDDIIKLLPNTIKTINVFMIDDILTSIPENIIEINYIISNIDTKSINIKVKQRLNNKSLLKYNRHIDSNIIDQFTKLIINKDINTINNTIWPISLTSIDFNRRHIKPEINILQNIIWPDHIKEINFGDYYNNSIDNIKWPRYLKRLIFGHCFDCT
jgi:hypothetical protein